MGVVEAVCLALMLLGLVLPPVFLMSLSFVLASFGSLAVIRPEYTGGSSVVVGSVAALCLVVRVCLMSGGLRGVSAAMLDRRRLVLLTLFTLVAVVSAFILPRLFQGRIDVIPVRARGLRFFPEPVAPSSTNFTQCAYLAISLGTAAAYGWLARRRLFVRDFAIAILAGAIATVATGLLDLIASRVGLVQYLDLFRTASYAYLVDNEVQGVKRTVGLMPEASAYGAVTVFFFAALLFLRDLFSAKFWRFVVGPLTAACAVLAVLSTSSTAYVALAVTGLAFGADGFARLWFGRGRERSRALRELVLLLAAGVLLLFATLILDSTRELLFKIIDHVVLQKTESASFRERSMWTSVAFDAWRSSGGLGVGAGTVRASNFFVNLLASTGVLGFALFAAFLMKVMTAPAPSDSQRAVITRGLKLALLPMLASAALAGTTIDYGAIMAALFGVIIGVAHVRSHQPFPSPPRRSRTRDAAVSALPPDAAAVRANL